MIKEFKEFISKGNVVDLAVGVIIGGIDFSDLTIKVGEAKVAYGLFIQNVIDFLIIALCIFFMTKIINKFTKKQEKVEEVVEEPKKDENTILLEEIRDLLKENARKG